VAHGGQVLATRSVVDVASSHLVHDLSFRSLGHHRVRDVPDPIELFQLYGDGLRDSFPPLHTPAFTATALMAVVSVDEVGASDRYEGTHEQLIAWQRRLIQSLRDLCDRHDGRYLKLIGDSCVVGFEDPRAALAFASDVHRRASFRIGIALGLVEVVEGELAGKPLMEAFWLQRKAGPGETQCSVVMERICS